MTQKSIASANNKPRVMVVGFGEEVHQAMAQVFNLVHIVANSQLADTQWDDLYAFKLKGLSPTSMALNDGSYQYVVGNYRRYADMNSRRYITINTRESEIFNGFMYYFYWAHDVLTRKKPELMVFHNLPHESFDYVLYLIAKFFGIRTIVLHQCFLLSDRFWISESMETFGDFDAQPEINERVRSNYKLPENWYYMNDVSSKWLYTLRDFLKEIIMRPWRMPVAAMRFYYNRAYDVNRNKYVKEYDEKSQYIYFPLHLQPELTTSAMGGIDGRYGDQIQALEQLSLLIPSDVVIYVKENPKQTAQQRDELFFARLSILPNVHLVSPATASRELIKNSIGVATITGTAGWEALFYGKPCMIFGNAWYANFQGVTRFSATISFNDWMSNLPESNDDLISSLDDLLMKTGKGVVDPMHAVMVKDFDSKCNGRDIANSLKAYIGIIKK